MALNITPLSTKEEQILSKATIMALMKMINASPLIEKVSYSIDQDTDELPYFLRGSKGRNNRVHLELKVDFVIDMKDVKTDLVQFIVSDGYKRSIQF